MRRRGFLVGLPLGLLGLGACGPDGGEPAAPTPAPPVEHTGPVLLGERAEVVEHTEVRLPIEMTPMIVVDPGWTSTPLELDGIFLGYREEETHLRFLAVDQDGTLLWRADRPLTCTGYVLTRGAGHSPVAVLADLAAPAEGALSTMTLTAYDLRTAEPSGARSRHSAPRRPRASSTRRRPISPWGRAAGARRCPAPPGSPSSVRRTSRVAASSASTWAPCCAPRAPNW